MKSIKLPKSIPDSQRFVAWSFPILFAYGVTSLPDANFDAAWAVVVCLMIVVTGWQSFGIVEEGLYNDLLLITDLSLLASYWLLIYFCRSLSAHPNIADVPVYFVSGTVFFLYATWNVAALAGSDTRALATVAHLKKFAWITFFVGLVFFVIGSVAVNSEIERAHIYRYCRIVSFLVWVSIISWWQLGKFIAAARDVGSPEGQ